MARISIVVTAYNARHSIERCLTSLAAQTADTPDEIEIVMVDDRSIDGTADTVAALGIPNLRLIRITQMPENGLTTRQQALDTGFRDARGEVIVVTDADGVASSDWAQHMAQPILFGETDAVAGGVSFHSADGSSIGAWQSVDQSVYLSHCRLLAMLGGASGVLFGNFAFRRQLYFDVGGFAGIGRTLTEDLAFSQALTRNGHRIGYSAQHRVRVDACESWDVLIERAKRVSAGGVTPIGIWIGVWMALLIGSAIAVPFVGPWPLIIRYGAGVAHTAFAIVAARRWNLLPLALLYEPIAIAIGAVVAWRLRRGRIVEWGGTSYDR